ncbi:unnamed protein product [Toxocara canis]|uniref:Uncharacterized protein n=1 Tax=Toxocara canis TaxID=6265 RepID=A0A3P7H2K7_TOXCA|nr:unnamed protein product [Toxocara canis]
MKPTAQMRRIDRPILPLVVTIQKNRRKELGKPNLPLILPIDVFGMCQFRVVMSFRKLLFRPNQRMQSPKKL